MEKNDSKDNSLFCNKEIIKILLLVEILVVRCGRVVGYLFIILGRIIILFFYYLLNMVFYFSFYCYF